jgi:DeoR family fructose operon transcriptional repressor
MRIKKDIVNNRRKKILDKLEHEKEVRVSDLAEEEKVSELTIRRDLDFLEESGKLERFHGGARLVEDTSSLKNKILEDKKERIAKKCAEFISEDDDIFINSSSTALLTLKYIKDKRINVITNNATALDMDLDAKISVILTGGKINFPRTALTGTFAMNNLSLVASDITIIGISGITEEGELTTVILDQVEINSYMLEKSTRLNILVCDSSKFSKKANYKSGDIDQIDILITDDEIKRETIEALEKRGISVILA